MDEYGLWMQEKPFYLKEDGIAWVKHIFSCMTDEQKIGQLFVLECVSNDLSYIKPYLEKAEPGGVTLRADQTDSIKLFTHKPSGMCKNPSVDFCEYLPWYRGILPLMKEIICPIWA